MKKIFIAAIFLTAIFIGTACAEEQEPSGAAAAPAEINHADSIYYRHPDFYNMTSTDTLTILTHYPTYQQTNEYSCGAAAALTVLKYFGCDDFDEATLIKLMKTKPKIGTRLGNMVKFFKSIGWEVQSSLDRTPMEEDAFKKFVVRNLAAGRPIIVDNIEWGGHWRVIIGVDTMGTPEDLYDDVLIFADPYDTSDHKQDGYTIGSLDRFYSMWFARDLFPKAEHNQPWLIAFPKK